MRLGLRVAIGGVLFAGFLIVGSTAANAADCARLTIEAGVIVDAPAEDMGVSWALYGPESMILQIQTGADRGLGEGIGSSVVLDSTDGIATVCADGSVTFEPAVDPMPVEVVVDIPATPSVEYVADPTWSFLTHAGLGA